VIREALSAVARNESLGGVLGRTPIARDVVKRLVGGDDIDSVIEVAEGLADRGFNVSIERSVPGEVGEGVPDQVAEEYAGLVVALSEAGIAPASELAVVPEALGAADPDGLAERRLRDLAEQCARAGVALVIGFGPGTDAEVSLGWAERLHADGLDVGVTLPAALRRTEADCERLSGRRVRLVKGGRGGAAPVAHGQPIEIDKAFVRCAKSLLAGTGEPSFATHDNRIVEVLESLATRYRRPRHSYEFAFFMGRQEGTQERLLAAGECVRVYVPYGPEWFSRLVGGLAEQPSSITAAVRSLLPGS
jgi:proline dehydrogenase